MSEEVKEEAKPEAMPTCVIGIIYKDEDPNASYGGCRSSIGVGEVREYFGFNGGATPREDMDAAVADAKARGVRECDIKLAESIHTFDKDGGIWDKQATQEQ
jgi:hypothetical protein